MARHSHRPTRLRVTYGLVVVPVLVLGVVMPEADVSGSARADPAGRQLPEKGAALRLMTWSPCGHPGRIAPNRGHGDHGHHHGHHIPDL